MPEDDPLTSVRPRIASGRGCSACGGCVARGQWLADWVWVRRSVHGGDGGEVQGLHEAGGDGRYIVCMAGIQESDVGAVPKQMFSGPSTRPAVTVGTSSARRQVSKVGHMWGLGRGMTCCRGDGGASQISAGSYIYCWMAGRSQYGIHRKPQRPRGGARTDDGRRNAQLQVLLQHPSRLIVVQPEGHQLQQQAGARSAGRTER